MDGRGGIVGNCVRCNLLFDIWEASLTLNRLIRGFDPNHDDLKKPPTPGSAKPQLQPDPRQMSLIGD